MIYQYATNCQQQRSANKNDPPTQAPHVSKGVPRTEHRRRHEVNRYDKKTIENLFCVVEDTEPTAVPFFDDGLPNNIDSPQHIPNEIWVTGDVVIAAYSVHINARLVLARYCLLADHLNVVNC